MYFDALGQYIKKNNVNIYEGKLNGQVIDFIIWSLRNIYIIFTYNTVDY